MDAAQPGEGASRSLLVRQLKELEGWAGWERKKIAELERSIQVTVRLAPRLGVHAEDTLRERERELTDRKKTLERYEHRIQAVASEIKALSQPTPEQAKDRREKQHQLAGLASYGKRLDGEIEKPLQLLRQLLRKREKLTAEMESIAGLLEFTGDLDALRAKTLLSSLPASFAPRSEEWLARFLGKGQAYVVIQDGLTLSETLTHLGNAKFGDTVYLLPEEAAELAREDRSANVPNAPWKLLPPSVVTLEAFQKAAAEAAEFVTPDCDLKRATQIAFQAEHQQRERERQKQYEESRKREAERQAAEEHAKRVRGIVGASNPEPSIPWRTHEPQPYIED